MLGKVQDTSLRQVHVNYKTRRRFHTKVKMTSYFSISRRYGSSAAGGVGWGVSDSYSEASRMVREWKDAASIVNVHHVPATPPPAASVLSVRNDRLHWHHNPSVTGAAADPGPASSPDPGGKLFRQFPVQTS